jgi:hypothetical protein
VFFAQSQFAAAQSISAADVAELIEINQRRYELDDQGCPKYREEGEEDVIMVCGSSDANEEFRVRNDDNDNGEDRIRRGEAVSTRRAAACIAGITDCPIWLPATVGMGFGYVPPPVIPLDVVMKGLADPENVVVEGSVDSGGRPIAANPNP